MDHSLMYIDCGSWPKVLTITWYAKIFSDAESPTMGHLE